MSLHELSTMLHLDWVGGISAVLSMLMTGRGKWTGWVVSAFAQVPLLVLNIDAHYYGLIPLSVFAFSLSVYNAVKWRRNAR